MEPRIIAASARHIEFELRENHPLRLKHAAGRRIACVEGMLWITAYNERHDFLVAQGESFVVPNGGLALIEAVGQARARIQRRRWIVDLVCVARPGAAGLMGLAGRLWTAWRPSAARSWAGEVRACEG